MVAFFPSSKGRPHLTIQAWDSSVGMDGNQQNREAGESLTTVTENQDFELVGVQTNVTTREDVPPDGGCGWICTLCVLLINAHTWGVNSVC